MPLPAARLRLAYLGLAAADTLLSGSSGRWSRRARLVTKPLLMPTLAASLATDRRARRSPLRTSTLTGQVAGWAGDLALLGEGTGRFEAGAVSFAVGHLGYQSGFRRSRDTRLPTRQAGGPRAVAAAWALSAPYLAHRAARREPGVGKVVLGYSAVLATTTATATHLSPALPREARTLTALGGALFLLSDTVLGWRRFVVGEGHPRLESVVMATYTAAQLCLAEGARRAVR